MKYTDFLTDMAVEAAENAKSSLIPYSVQRLEGGIVKTVVKVDTAEKSRIVGKKQGIYVTLESPDAVDKKTSDALTKHMTATVVKLAAAVKKGIRKVVVVGLGNDKIEADALGPLTVEKLNVTRPYFKSQSPKAVGKTELCAVVPGVYAATGIESEELCSAVINKVSPDIIIAVDALAAAKARRLYNSFQLTTAGIVPGSGVGASVGELSEKTMGVPVIGIGVPLALYASSIVRESIFAFAQTSGAKCGAADVFGAAESVLGADKTDIVVTPKNIGKMVENASSVIACAINKAFGNKR